MHEGKLAVFSRVYGPLPGVPVPAASSPHAGVRYTKLTVLNVAAAAPEVLRESYLAGDYAFSRRQGSVVRGVLQYARSARASGAPGLRERSGGGGIAGAGPRAYRGLLRGADVFSVNNVSLTGHTLDTLGAPALSSVEFPTFIY